jgi:hypothetical protein
VAEADDEIRRTAGALKSPVAIRGEDRGHPVLLEAALARPGGGHADEVNGATGGRAERGLVISVVSRQRRGPDHLEFEAGQVGEQLLHRHRQALFEHVLTLLEGEQSGGGKWGVESGE